MFTFSGEYISDTYLRLASTSVVLLLFITTCLTPLSGCGESVRKLLPRTLSQASVGKSSAAGCRRAGPVHWGGLGRSRTRSDWNWLHETVLEATTHLGLRGRRENTMAVSLDERTSNEDGKKERNKKQVLIYNHFILMII